MFFVRLYFYVRSFCALCAFCLLCRFSSFSQWPYVCGGSQRRHVYFSTWLFLVSPNFSIISLNWAILAWMFSKTCSSLLLYCLQLTPSVLF